MFHFTYKGVCFHTAPTLKTFKSKFMNQETNVPHGTAITPLDDRRLQALRQLNEKLEREIDNENPLMSPYGLGRLVHYQELIQHIINLK